MSAKTRNQATPWIDFKADDHRWVQAQIERQAYRLWQARGRPEHDELGDWLRAEQEVLGRFCEARERQLPVRSAPIRPEKQAG